MFVATLLTPESPAFPEQSRDSGPAGLKPGAANPRNPRENRPQALASVPFITVPIVSISCWTHQRKGK